MLILKQRKTIGVVAIFVVIVIFIISIIIVGLSSNNVKDGDYSTTTNFSSSGTRAEEVTETPTPTPTPDVSPTITATPSPTNNPVIPDSEVSVINCSNCSFAPVDKQNALPSTYAPGVVATGLSGGGYLTLETKNQLSQLFNDAAAEGINITIISAYRSYANQQSTFEYWVQQEMNAGYSREVAEQRANTYSARPGHSEHQLGTTVDLKCSTCASFDNSSGNLALYEFLRTHGHEYGFVTSYPIGKENLTGYVAESWHVRYIGVGLATELYNRGYLSSTNNEYLTAFLREKGLY